MDQTTKPLLIPPQFALYAEEHNLFELYQRMLSNLIIHKPDDPLQYLSEFLKKDSDSLAIVVIGPPVSGKTSLAKLISKKTGAILLNQTNLIDSAPNNLKAEFGKDFSNNKKLEPQQWAKLIKARTDEYDCVRKGWVLENFPETRAQSLAMLTIGTIPKHTILLQASDAVLIERAPGRRIDTKTGDVYHTTFDWPSDGSVLQRLIVPEKNSEEDIVNRLVAYHRHAGGVQDSLKANLKVINVDQPKGDVFNQILDFISKPARSHAPATPRIILLGPYGCGRRTQAQALAKKYDIVNVSMSNLIKEAVAHESLLGVAIKPHYLKKTRIPDSLILPLLKERLGKLDCVSRGWILHGFPRSREQAEALDAAGFSPNRVFFLDIPNDSIIERTTLRHLDPITGERYHIIFNPPSTQEIRERLSQKPSDNEDSIRVKISEYYTHVNNLHDFYEEVGIHVNADQDPNTVFESLESGVVNSVPKLKNEPSIAK